MTAPAGPGEQSLRGWRVLRDCPLGGPGGVVLPYALLHPGMGVALLDLEPHRTPGAEALLRQRLDATRFGAIFPGSLPVAHLLLPPERLPDLPQVLDAAFARLPPMTLAGGDSWVQAVSRALTTNLPHVPPPNPARIRRAARRRHRRILAGLALAGGAVAVAVGIMLLPVAKRPADPPVAIATAPAIPDGPTPLPEPDPLPPAPAAAPAPLAPVPDAVPSHAASAPLPRPPAEVPRQQEPEPSPPSRREVRRPAPPISPPALAPGPQYLDAARPMPAPQRPDTVADAEALPSRMSPEQELRNLVRCRRILAGIQSGSLPPEGELRFFDRFCQPG